MLPTFLEAEGPNYFTGDAQTCPEDSLQRAGSQCWRSSAKKRCCSSGWHTKGAHKHAILIPHSCSPSMEEMGKVRNCFCSYERKLVTTKLIVTPSFFFLQKFGGFHWKGKNWKMFGFWQSKTGNFLATNQNNLGFLVFGFGILPNSLAFHCQKLHIFQVFLTQWKPQNCCWNWTFPTENFWYYKEKKKTFSAEKKCFDWTISSSSVNTSLGRTITSSLLPSLPRWLFSHPWEPKGCDQGLVHPTANLRWDKQVSGGWGFCFSYEVPVPTIYVDIRLSSKRDIYIYISLSLSLSLQSLDSADLVWATQPTFDPVILGD